MEHLKQVRALMIAAIKAIETLDNDAYLAEARDYIQNNLGRPQTSKSRFNFSTSSYHSTLLGD
ncbi:hypothetical protein [Bartonella sp. AD13SXNS]|uniref:hypothetical protein n=1 Tax=Bartonella sp. AD13SXNS TaxID=3243462 RepID=UPI0035CF5968